MLKTPKFKTEIKPWTAFLLLIIFAYSVVIVAMIFQETPQPKPWDGCKHVEIREGPQQEIQSSGWLCPDGITYWGYEYEQHDQ